MSQRSAPLFMLVACWLVGALIIPSQTAYAESTPVDRPPLNAEAAAAIANIERIGGVVRWASGTDSALEADLSRCGSAFADDQLAELPKLPNLTRLRLKGTGITDQGLKVLQKLPALKRLYLEHTAVTDACAVHLTGLRELEFLNLYGTGVSDAGLNRLEGLPKLQRLYVGQTKVTEAGIEQLKRSKSGLRITPDPVQDRRAAEIILTHTRAMLTELETVLEAGPALPAKLVEIRKAAEDANDQAVAAKVLADEARKKYDDLKTDEAKRTFDELQAKAAKLQKTADESQKASEKAFKGQKDGVDPKKQISVYRALVVEAEKRVESFKSQAQE